SLEGPVIGRVAIGPRQTGRGREGGRHPLRRGEGIACEQQDREREVDHAGKHWLFLRPGGALRKDDPPRLRLSMSSTRRPCASIGRPPSKEVTISNAILAPMALETDDIEQSERQLHRRRQALPGVPDSRRDKVFRSGGWTRERAEHLAVSARCSASLPKRWREAGLPSRLFPLLLPSPPPEGLDPVVVDCDVDGR